MHHFIFGVCAMTIARSLSSFTLCSSMTMKTIGLYIRSSIGADIWRLSMVVDDLIFLDINMPGKDGFALL